jgi:hypothetical protein
MINEQALELDFWLLAQSVTDPSLCGVGLKRSAMGNLRDLSELMVRPSLIASPLQTDKRWLSFCYLVELCMGLARLRFLGPTGRLSPPNDQFEIRRCPASNVIDRRKHRGRIVVVIWSPKV